MSRFKTERFLSRVGAAMALIPGSGILVLISISNQSLFTGAPALLSLLQAPIALAFSAVFFAPAWLRIPIKVEGQFLQWRYSDSASAGLAVLRNVLLTFVIAPLLIALTMVAIVDWPALNIVDRQSALYVCTTVLIGLSLTNSLRHRLKMDIAVGIITLVSVLFYALYTALNHTPMSLVWTENLIPILSKISNSDILISITIVWWFASIVDIPDIRAQKLLATKRQNGFWNPAAISALILVFIQGFFLAFPPTSIHSALIIDVVVGLMLLNGITEMLDLQHWAGGATLENVIRPRLGNTSADNIIGTGLMIIMPLIALCFSCWFEDVSHILMQVLFFTAGVGPVYILRWTWHKINAWTQGAAMLGAVCISLIWPFIVNRLHLSELSHSFFLISILLPGLINCLFWITVAHCTQDHSNGFSSKRKIATLGVLRDLRNWKKWVSFGILTLLLCLAMHWTLLVHLLCE